MAKKKQKPMSAGEKMQMEVYYITHYRDLLEGAMTPEEREAIGREAIDKLLSLRTEGGIIAAHEFGYSHLDYLNGRISPPKESGEERYEAPSGLIGMVGRAVGNGAEAVHSSIRRTIRKVRGYGNKA